MASELIKMKNEHAGLAWEFRVNPDSCDNPNHYEDYIQKSALSEQKIGRGTTFLHIIDERIAGYITLRANSLIIQNEDTLSGHPALEIAELAVDKDFERRGVGTFLVMTAVLKALELKNDHIGLQYVVLCADPKAVEFYKKDTINFEPARNYFEIPRDGWNDNCTPMVLRLPEE